MLDSYRFFSNYALKYNNVKNTFNIQRSVHTLPKLNLFFPDRHMALGRKNIFSHKNSHLKCNEKHNAGCIPVKVAN